MFRATLGLISVVVLSLANSASASDRWYYSGGRYYYQHDRLHDNLGHSAYHRAQEHRDAHRYPMTWRQHERLHDSLDREAYHDARDHSRWHRYNDYRYYSYRPPYRNYYGSGVYFGGGSSRIFVGW